MKSSYALRDLDELFQFFQVHDTLKLKIKDNGLYPAMATEQNDLLSGYANTWVRDTVMITNYQVEIGNFDVASKTISTLRDFFYKHRFRFINIIEGKADRNNPMERPHIRFNGDSLEEINQKWAHAQNDALGYFLWMSFRLANKNKHELTPKDYEIYALFPRYFEAIEYWQDSDSGHWEEARKIESSSIGVVVAGLKEMKRFLENQRINPFAAFDKTIKTDYLDKLIAYGEKQLQAFLPYESPPRRKADGALLFLIYPLEVISGQTAQDVLNLTLKELKGMYGIKRYIGDSYWCADYKKFLDEKERTVDFSDNIDKRDQMLKPGAEAQWCIFDPVVSIIYGKKYLASGIDEDLVQQTYYFNRSLGQITSNEFSLGRGKCPEAYYLEDSTKGVYIPNDHVPLAWTQANLGIAVEYLKQSLSR
jgi:phosphorylase kinase alpha/beta subunit